MYRFNRLGADTSRRRDGSSSSPGLAESGGGSAATPTTSLLKGRLTSEIDPRVGMNTSGSGSSMNGPLIPTPASSSGASSSSFPQTTPWSPSSARAHRGPYSKPALLDLRPPTNRPYTIRKPICVRARKVTDEESLEPHLTSTAQRMIEILQRNTTPTVEGLRKVPLHTSAIKTVKPMMSNVRSGPPITRSPLALDATPSALTSPVVPAYLLAKKVPTSSPSTSNTIQQLPPPLVNTSPYSQLPTFGMPSTHVDFNYDGQTKSVGGGKVKGKTTRVHDSVVRPTQGPTSFVPRELKPLPMESQASTASLVQTKPPSPLPPVQAKFSFSPALSLKPKGKSLPNGLPEETPFWKELFQVVKSHPIKPCAAPPLVTKASLPTPTPSSMSIPIQTQTSTWPCPTCLIHNKLGDSNCVCCTEPRPAKYSSAETVTKKPEILPSKWPCPTCMVDNKISDPSCVCCTEPRPTKYTSMLGTTGGGNITQAPKPEPPAFKFGFSSTTPSAVGTSKSSDSLPGFSFAAPKATTSQLSSASSNFKFGISTSSSSASDSVPSAFKFGTSNPSPSTSAPFQFGIPSTTPSSNSGAFTFGIKTPAVSTTNTVDGGKSSDFKFKTSDGSSDKPTSTNTPLSANAFRKGFGLTESSEGVAVPNTTLNENGTKPASTIKFPTFPVSKAENKDLDADIAKYKFPLFSGGPKPAFSSTVGSGTSSQPTKAATNFPSVATTTTVSSAQTPISFGGIPTASTVTSAPPIANGIDLFKKPVTASVSTPSFSFGTPSVTSNAKETVPAPTPTSGFSFGLSNTAAVPPTTTATSTPTQGFTFGSLPSTTLPPTTTTPSFSFGTATPSTISNTGLSQPVISFGTGESHKRKAPPSEGNGPFQFGSMEPKVKMRSDTVAGTGDVSVMKTGSFLDAMKQPGFGLGGDKPDGRSNTFGNSLGTGGFSNPNAGFQFTALNSNTLPPPPPASSGFTFGGTPSTTTNTNNVFSFGSPQPSATPQTQFTPNLVPNFSFGQNPGTASTAPVLFSAGASPATQPGGRPVKRGVRRLR